LSTMHGESKEFTSSRAERSPVDDPYIALAPDDLAELEKR
jgi:hypothetical protein